MSEFKIGDLISNGWASDDNPYKVVMVLNVGKFISCIGRDGKRVNFQNDSRHKLKKVGEVDFKLWDWLLENREDHGNT